MLHIWSIFVSYFKNDAKRQAPLARKLGKDGVIPTGRCHTEQSRADLESSLLLKQCAQMKAACVRTEILQFTSVIVTSNVA